MFKFLKWKQRLSVQTVIMDIRLELQYKAVEFSEASFTSGLWTTWMCQLCGSSQVQDEVLMAIWWGVLNDNCTAFVDVYYNTGIRNCSRMWDWARPWNTENIRGNF